LSATPTPPPWARWTDHVLRLEDTIGWAFAERPLEPKVEATARLMLLDTIGCMLAGRAAPEVRALEEEYAALESGPCRFPGGRRLSTSGAMAIGATAATWDEACEGIALAHGRPGVPVIAALLPLALARDARLKALLQALVAGYETGARAGHWLRIRPGMHVDANWPALGVAAAVAHLIGREAADAFAAVNTAACQLPTSLYLPVAAGNTARNTYLAHAAQLGTAAAMSARAGIDAPRDALAAYAEHFSAAPPEPLIPSGRHLILESYLKPYAAVRHVHYGAQAARALREEMGEGTTAVSRIALSIYVEAITYCGNRNPQTPIQAQFSLSFGVAAMLRFGALDPSMYRKDRFFDPELRRLEKLVTVRADPVLTAAGRRGANLKVEAGYSEHEIDVAGVKGDAADPLSQEEVVAKFLRYSHPAVAPDKAYHFAAALLASTDDVEWRSLWDLLF
jgi:2-methylcitrate dehydratase PrpD